MREHTQTAENLREQIQKQLSALMKRTHSSEKHILLREQIQEQIYALMYQKRERKREKERRSEPSCTKKGERETADEFPNLHHLATLAAQEEKKEKRTKKRGDNLVKERREQLN